MSLPPDYIEIMQSLLGTEFEKFIHAYQEPRSYGLRVNTSKINIECFQRLVPFKLTPIPWAFEGFYYQPEDEPGKHPYHDAGLYYIQEPSAMAVVGLLDPQPGERILDLAAAPGGKATHIATRLQGQGILVANELIYSRAKVLSQNIERLGIPNALITSETPAILGERFSEFFQRVLVDAPCSGEGMFRKNPEAALEWSSQHVQGCALRQQNILESAAQMVAPGGVLVYSTCTFNPRENEQVISDFLAEHPEFTLEEVENYPGFAPAEPSWANPINPTLSKAVRLWPHKLRGEGHFLARLTKKDGSELTQVGSGWQEARPQDIRPYTEFAAENLRFAPQGQFLLFGQNLYLLPQGLPALDGLKVLRPGWHLGSIRKNHFLPSHALALSLAPQDVQNSLNLNSESTEVKAYLKGETIQAQGQKGWHLVSVDGYSLGWGKLVGSTLKNHYPKGLRRSL